jgi:hypothetical protein
LVEQKVVLIPAIFCHSQPAAPLVLFTAAAWTRSISLYSQFVTLEEFSFILHYSIEYSINFVFVKQVANDGSIHYLECLLRFLQE